MKRTPSVFLFVCVVALALAGCGDERGDAGLAAELGFAPDVLHTFDAVAGYSFQPIAAYALSLLRKRAVIPYPVRSAAVARTPETLALARIFIALNRTRNLTMEVFDSEEKGRRWIAAKPVDGDE